MSKAAGQRSAAQKKGDSGNNKINAEQMYAVARKQGSAFVKEGGASLEDVKAKVVALRGQEVSFQKHLAAFEPVVEAQEAAFESLLSLYPPMLEELGPRRAERLNSACKFNQTTQAKREAFSRHISRQARRQLEETKQRAHDATDATHLIKTLKAIVKF